MVTVAERINASVEILKRYMISLNINIESYKFNNEYHFYNKKLNLTKEEQRYLLTECIDVSCSHELDKDKKRAARVVMEIICGKKNTNDILEDKAVVTKRTDPLVRRWRNRVIKRDKRCRSCGSEENLHAHHISRWIDDPVNRINDDNGIALCSVCHSEYHEELKELIMSNRRE